MPVPVTPGNPTQDSGYLQFNVTIASTGVAQQLTTSSIGCSEYILQVPFGGAKIHIGGPGVTTSTGVELDPASSATVTPDGFGDYVDDLKKVWVIGTAATVINVLYRTL